MKNFISKLYQLITSLVWILRISAGISRLKFIVRLMATILYAALPIASAWVLKIIIDTALGGETVNSNGNFLIFLIAMKVVLDVSWYFTDTFLESLFKIMRFDLEANFIDRVIKKLNFLDLEFFENSKFLDLKQKALDTYGWRPTQLLDVAYYAFYNLLQVAIQSLIIISINPRWLIYLLLFQLPALFILLKIGQAVWNIWDADSTTRRKFLYFSTLFENIAYIKEFKLYHVGDFFIEKVKSLVSKFHKNQKEIEKKRIVKGFGGVLLSNIPSLYITVNLLLMLANGKISPGLLTFYLTNLGLFSLALSNLVKNINFGFEVNLYVYEIRRFLEIQNKVINRSSTIPAGNFKTNTFTIEFKNISFAYPGSKRKVFSDFSLMIKPNKKIALVGENGSGKTTLIKLLCRFYDVQKGSIEFGGVDIRKIPLEILRSCFAVLFQDFVGYDLTVSENIAVGKIESVDNIKLVKKAAITSGAHEFIKKLPQKYEQLLGTAFESGEQLSVGQWQRIALAKTFMRNSPVIILDEPTASVDAKTENEIFNKVMALIKDKTVLMTSHRFSTVRNADEIVVLKEGTIIERGTHEKLLGQNGEYAQMFNLQAKAYS